MTSGAYISRLEELLEEKQYDYTYRQACVNYAKRLYENNLPVIFDTIHFSRLIGVETEELSKHLICEEYYYKEMMIPKKNGKSRKLCIPSVSMKYMQRWILDNILYKMHVSDSSTGFCRKRSIVNNAKNHTNIDCIVNFDIKDFFPSIGIDRVFRVFYYYGYTKEVSYVLAKICSYKERLPQGSPASPYLSNIVCLRLDKRLNQLIQKYEASYTRYADDITISGRYGIQNCMDNIQRIINEEGFELNPAKTRILYKHQKQEVTGLVVNNENVRIDRRYKRQVKQEIYYCLKYGVSSHLKHIQSDRSFYKEHLYGKVYFIKMVERELGEQLLGMLDKIEWEY